MKNKKAVKIMGRTYMVCGEECPEYLETVGKYVNAKVEAIREKYPFGSTTDAAVMVAIDIADELLKLRDEHIYMDGQLNGMKLKAAEEHEKKA